MEQQVFRSTAFGGFAKQDVVNYIEKTAKEAAEIQEALQKENDALRSETEQLKVRAETLQARLEEAEKKAAALGEQLAVETALRQALEPMKPEAERLAAEVEALRPDAEAYAQFRESLGSIECEARKRAADLEAETLERLCRIAEEFRAQYQTLVTTFDTTASHVTAELRKVEVNLTHLPRSMDRVGAELKELEKIFLQEKIQEV